MFRLKGFVEDKHVVQVMKDLTGKVIKLKMIPVINLDEGGRSNGKMRAVSDGNLLSMFEKYLKEKKIHGEVNSDLVKDFLKSVGKSPSSAYYLRTEAIKGGVLKKTGKASQTRYHTVEVSK